MQRNEQVFQAAQCPVTRIVVIGWRERTHGTCVLTEEIRQ